MRVSVVVPCCDERESVGQTIERLVASVGELAEIVVVDDGSRDGSAEVIEAAAARWPNVVLIRHDGNLGYGAALKSGIRASTGEAVVITDADGTYPVERIPDLLTALEGADMVVGNRFADGPVGPWARRLPRTVLRRYVSWLVRRPVPDMNSGLRAMRREVLERYLHLLPDSFSFTTSITVVLMRRRFRVRFVPVEYSERVGLSKLKPIRDTARFLQVILRTGAYFAPMRVFAPVTGALLLLGAASFVHDVVVERNLTDTTVLLLLFGVQTGLLALLGDMIDKRSG
jgi:glycosyltransferase involved in cell wall biosynthesis